MKNEKEEGEEVEKRTEEEGRKEEKDKKTVLCSHRQVGGR